MAAPKIYITTRSVKLPGTGGGGDAVVYWAASYDPDPGDCRYRVFKVTGFSGSAPTAGAILEEADLTLADTSGATPTWQREEVGYAWPSYSSVVPDLDGSSVPTPSGLYAIQVRETTGAGGSWVDAETAYFVVRRTPTAEDKVLVCYPFATTLAYAGTWHWHGNLYDSFEWQRLRRVARDRPLGIEKLRHTVELPFLMEQFIRAFDSGSLGVDVCTSFDLHEDPSLLDDYDLFVSVGHDEYWSKEMSDAVKAFVEDGGNVAFFSANTAWWQVRFEIDNTIMVCFKSAAEDPETEPTALTGNFCSPPSIEENTLTGVSYRRGTQGASSTPYTKLAGANSDPYGYLSGVPATFGPTGLFTLESDACEYRYEEAPKAYFATGVDGSPRNFEVLAVADMRQVDTLAQRGMATLGYYTNVGTVFTAGTTEWAAHLADTNIETITNNVLADLRQRTSRAPASFDTRTYPSTSWQSLGGVSGTIPAICGIVEGHLVYQETSGALVLDRDPENPSGSSVTTAIPSRTDLQCYGSDLWGTYVFAGSSNGSVYRRSGRITDAASWATSFTAPETGWAPRGIGAHDRNPFVVFQSGSESRLYRHSAVWTRLSRLYPPLRPIASFDGKLYGVRDPGTSDSDPLDLYCREASPVDLTWTKIGTAPAGTYAIAAYYGRLFVLSGTSSVDPTLSWRSTLGTADFPYLGPSVLFLDGATFEIGRLSSDGDYLTTGSGTVSFSYTHATRANDGLVFFYDSANGTAQVVRFEANGTYTIVKAYDTPGSFGSWTHIVYVREGYRSWTDLSPVKEKVLFYNSSGNNAYVGHFDPTYGDFVTDWYSSAFSTGWTKIACTYKGDIFFYNGATGAYSYGSVDASGAYYGAGSGSGLSTGWDAIAPAGHTYLFFYKSDGSASLVELFGGVDALHNYALGNSLTVVGAANGTVLTYRAGDGSADVLGFCASTTSSDAQVLLRGYPAGAFRSAWAYVVPAGIL